MMTRSHSRSTSPMLWEASRIVAPRRSPIALKMCPHPVGRIGVERGGRLVEHQHLRLVDQRLGQRNARLLSGRELSGGPVEEFGKRRVRGQARDARGDVRHVIEPGEYGKVLPHGQPMRQVDIGAFEIDAMEHPIGLLRHVGAEHLHPSRRSGRPAPSSCRWSWSCRRRCRPAARSPSPAPAKTKSPLRRSSHRNAWSAVRLERRGVDRQPCSWGREVAWRGAKMQAGRGRAALTLARGRSPRQFRPLPSVRRLASWPSNSFIPSPGVPSG